MKSLGILAAFAAALAFAGCSSSPSGSDGMMTGKDGKCSAQKEGSCSSDGQKKDCCASEAKKDSCCEGKGSETAVEKKGCCAEGKSEAKVKSGCCKGKEVSAACAKCKKACEAGSCDDEKKCEGDKKCDECPAKDAPKP